jgi:hypothetical protein
VRQRPAALASLVDLGHIEAARQLAVLAGLPVLQRESRVLLVHARNSEKVIRVVESWSADVLALAASVFTADDYDPDAAACLALLSPKVGRLCANDWPTGVAYTWAQQHGGPWPSTSASWATSGGRCRLGPVRAPCELSIAEGRVAAIGAPGGKPLEPFPSGQRRASTALRDAMSLPLEGLLVADFSQKICG